MARKHISRHYGLWARAKSIVARSSPLLRSAVRVSDLTPHQIGELGEQIALKYLQTLGWKFLYRNFRGPKGGEVDLIFRGGPDRNVLIFVEVKTRTRTDFGRPLRAVTKEKQVLITRGASEWLRLLGKENRGKEPQDARRKIAWRYDVVEIVLQDGERPQINLVEQAFENIYESPA